MSLKENKQIVRRYQDIYNSNILDALGEVVVAGTHTGEFWGFPATGKRVEFTGIYIVRIEGGKIIEHWGEEDGLSLMQQLGLMPTG